MPWAMGHSSDFCALLKILECFQIEQTGDRRRSRAWPDCRATDSWYAYGRKRFQLEQAGSHYWAVERQSGDMRMVWTRSISSVALPKCRLFLVLNILRFRTRRVTRRVTGCKNCPKPYWMLQVQKIVLQLECFRRATSSCPRHVLKNYERSKYFFLI